MFKFLRKNNQPDEEDLLRSAMGELYFNAKAREQIRRRLGSRDISELSPGEIYSLVNEVISTMRGMGYAT
jgi:hypothetical protein